ncbi:MAG: hypothetical protein JNK22_04180 [Rhodocyclaceae bacterium]|nr:hypothetical protein [Rhodocyclaceae bacterium]
MLRLPRSLAAWNTSAFAETLRQELEAAGAGHLPLQAGLAATSVAVEEGLRVLFLGAEETPGQIRVRVGIFYSGIVAGCNCADDPTPVEPQPEYCDLILLIDRETACTKVALGG